MRFQTQVVQTGRIDGEQAGAVTCPIYQTSTFAQEEAGCPVVFQGRQLSYGRTENPTRTTLETVLASLESASYGVAFSSGLAAIQAVFSTLATGDRVVACEDIYGGTYRMLTKVYQKFGVEVNFVDTTNLSLLQSAITPNTKIIWLESPSNPLLRITDIAAVAEYARARGMTVVVDNTFASPYLQQPLRLGATVVVESTTKYLNGHADVIGGVAMTNDEEWRQKLKFMQNATGTIPGPQDCFLVLRGVKTLALRMKQHCCNAFKIAAFLQRHGKVESVYYPGLPSHPGHDIAKRQMLHYGAMLSFVLDGDASAVHRFLLALKVHTIAESLGAVQSLVCHPPSMTHASIEPDVRRRTGIPDGLIRISVGIEDAEDLLDDLEQALDAV